MELLIDLIRVHVECDEQNSRSREWRGQSLDGTEKDSGRRRAEETGIRGRQRGGEAP